MIDLAGGDPERDRRLRTALRALQQRSDDPGFRALIDDVLAGRRELRDAASTPEFGRAVGPAVRSALDTWRELPSAERGSLLDDQLR